MTGPGNICLPFLQRFCILLIQFFKHRGLAGPTCCTVLSADAACCLQGRRVRSCGSCAWWELWGEWTFSHLIVCFMYSYWRKYITLTKPVINDLHKSSWNIKPKGSASSFFHAFALTSANQTKSIGERRKNEPMIRKAFKETGARH